MRKYSSRPKVLVISDDYLTPILVTFAITFKNTQHIKEGGIHFHSSPEEIVLLVEEGMVAWT